VKRVNPANWLILASAFAGVLMLAWFAYWSFIGTGNWATVKGTVVTSEIKEVSRPKRSNEIGPTMVTEYEVILEYRYTVSGTEYTGNRIWSLSRAIFPSRAQAEDTLAKYQPGSTVDVHYRPSNPADAVLWSAAMLPTRAKVGIGVLLALVSLIMLAAALWLRSRSAPA